jgi:hypothetical protein
MIRRRQGRGDADGGSARSEVETGISMWKAAIQGAGATREDAVENPASIVSAGDATKAGIL